MKIKLVIWDLDNTLWDGILDEGEVVPRRDRIKIVRELNDRGVVSSVCSKNDTAKAAAKLTEISLADELIFPSIAWEPKGLMVKSIIDSFQLRAENVLFIDDEEANLKEVVFYNAGVNTLNPGSDNFNEILERILSENSKDGRRRFNQYKNLEKKSIARKTYSDNKLFLRESGITIELDYRCEPYLERIGELINRTNQLNFTKRRLTGDELKRVLGGSNENFVVFGRDKFGDYGLIGFVSLKSQPRELEHFVFSCRVLNMGIEQYIYDKLGCPAIKLVGEVATELVNDGNVDWIREGRLGSSGKLKTQAMRSRVLIAGGCDLYQMHHLLKSGSGIDTYFNYPSMKYGIELHRDSLIYLYGSKYYSPSRQKTIIDNFPFVEPDFFVFPKLDQYDLVIYSPLVDYLQNTYAYREDPAIVISWGDFTNPTGAISDEGEFLRSAGFTADQIATLSSKWTPLGPISAENFRSKLNAVFDGFRGKLVLVGGASGHIPDGQQKYLDQHLRLNGVLKDFEESRASTYYVNIDNFLTGPGDFTSSIRHYQRHVYSRLATYIVENFYDLRRRNRVEVTIGKFAERLSRAARKLGFRSRRRSPG